MSDVRWITYAELADALGIGPDSARNLVRRKRWPRKPGNDGLARIGVPVEHLAERERPAPIGPPSGPPTSPPTEGAASPPSDPPIGGLIVGEIVSAFARHIERLERELADVRAERDAERARLVELAAEAAVAGALRDTVEALKTALASERGQLADMRADRDRLQRQAAPRGLFGWWKRAG